MKKYKYFFVELMLALLLIGLQVQAPVSASGVTIHDTLSNSDCQAPPAGQVQQVAQNCIVTNYIKPAINFLSVGVGVVVLAMVIIGAIQYSASGGNPQTVAAARKKIVNAVLALLLFAFSYAFLNFIIPGGIYPI
jgi:hypothetical protein